MHKVSPVKTQSVCGHLLFLCGDPILWKSQKELRNSHSSCESEIKATDECTKNVWCIRNILGDLSLLNINTPTTIYNDNHGAVDWANTTSNKNMQHFNIQENSACESIHEFNEVWVEHIKGILNHPSDLFTKEFKSDEVFHLLFLLAWMGGVGDESKESSHLTSTCEQRTSFPSLVCLQMHC